MSAFMAVEGNATSTRSENGSDQDEDGNFWQVNQYRRVVKRAEDGYKRCNDLVAFLLERAECERAFARQLKNWARRWNEQLDKRGFEYGTNAQAWSAFLVESNRTAEVHNGVAESLKTVVGRIKNWQRENYVKTVLCNKTIKEFEEEFKKAQKPWSKAHRRLQKTKREYHSACRNLSNAETTKSNVDCDENLGTENRKKQIERYERAKREKQLTEQKYKAAIEELKRMLPSYKNEMTLVFNRTQAFEKDRLQFFKDMFRSAHQFLDTSDCNELKQAYAELIGSIESVSPEADVDWWSKMYGADMQIALPEFEECSTSAIESPVLQSIRCECSPSKVTSELSSKLTVNCESSVQTRVNSDSIERAVPPPVGFVDRTIGGNVGSAVSSSQILHSDEQPLFKINTTSEYPEICNPFHAPIPQSPVVAHRSESYNNYGMDGKIPGGVPMRALYNYEAQEDDELPLQEGMIFTMVEGEDEQGWSRGRYLDKEGLYPAAYAEPVVGPFSS